MAPFRKAVLLYNPVSGSRAQREAAVARVAEILRPLAGNLIVEATRHAGSGAEQAHQAIADGADLIIACGGDGTVFDILQGVATTGAALAVVPFGTGNVLALDLGLPYDPIAAAKALLAYEPRRIAVGRIASTNVEAKYFTVAAGVGVHAELIYRSGAAAKKSHGIAAYYLSGFDLLFRHDFLPFTAEITAPDGTVTREEILELVAMRVSSFGRWLSRYRPGSSLESPTMQLIVLRESSRWAMCRYVFGALTGRAHRADMTSRSADVRFVPAIKVRCTAVDPQHKIRAQADGEMLGGLPAELEIVPDALTMMMAKPKR